MKLQWTPQLKVGLFAFVALFILAYATVRISQTSLLPGGTYALYVVIDSAAGVNKKTPVQIAGIQVGYVDGISLVENNSARVKLSIQKSVKVAKNVEAQLKTIGFLGDTYIELYQPGKITEVLAENAVITSVTNYGDFSSVTGQFGAIATDIKAITSTMRQLMAGEDSAFARSLQNIEKITDSLADVTTANQQNLHDIIANLRSISANLNNILLQNQGRINATFDNVAAITGKVRNGEGTIGRLINDDETVEKLNDAVDNLNDLLGGAGKLQVDIGYHAEYLGATADFKNYVELALKPAPDKYFLLEFVDDPAPDSKFSTRNTSVTSGGVTTEVTEEIETTNADQFLFSAQMAKKFYDLTLRGGLIESSGGIGLDYDYGPLGLKFSAFDFETKRGELPHLKAMGTVNVTKNIYMLGGVDDFINKDQSLDYFFGAGIRITDDDLKSLLSLTSLKP